MQPRLEGSKEGIYFTERSVYCTTVLCVSSAVKPHPSTQVACGHRLTTMVIVFLCDYTFAIKRACNMRTQSSIQSRKSSVWCSCNPASTELWLETDCPKLICFFLQQSANQILLCYPVASLLTLWAAWVPDDRKMCIRGVFIWVSRQHRKTGNTEKTTIVYFNHILCMYYKLWFL